MPSRVLWLLLTLSLGSGVAHAQRGVAVEGTGPRPGKRMALAIGNSAYDPSIGKLVNPAHDAEDMAGALRGLGFRVTLKENLDKEGMERAVDEFRGTLAGSAVVVFYYAGHGVAVENANYLVPLGVKLEKQSDAKYRAIKVDEWVGLIHDAAPDAAHIVILDACRNNPLPKDSRALGRGLAAAQSATGVLIAFSAGPGQTADENPDGRNGLYTAALLEQLRVPGQPVGEVFQHARESVYQRSGGRQAPQDWNQLVGSVVLKDAGAPYVAQPVAAGPGSQGLSLDDLASAAAKEKESRAAWGKRLAAMKADHSKVETLDKDEVSPQIKAEAWRRFLWLPMPTRIPTATTTMPCAPRPTSAWPIGKASSSARPTRPSAASGKRPSRHPPAARPSATPPPAWSSWLFRGVATGKAAWREIPSATTMRR